MKSSAAAFQRSSSSTTDVRGSTEHAPKVHVAVNNAATDADDQRSREPPNPLWVITIGMAVFFGAIAALMMFD